jgi:hypothetical protein
MARLVRERDRAAFPLGPVEGWLRSLRMAADDAVRRVAHRRGGEVRER